MIISSDHLCWEGCFIDPHDEVSDTLSRALQYVLMLYYALVFDDKTRLSGYIMVDLMM